MVQSCAGPLQIGPFCCKPCDAANWEIIIFACEICTLAHAPLFLFHMRFQIGRGMSRYSVVESTELTWLGWCCIFCSRARIACDNGRGRRQSCLMNRGKVWQLVKSG
jgi:hypothetical protein